MMMTKFEYLIALMMMMMMT